MRGISERGNGLVALLEPTGSDSGKDGPGSPIVVTGDGFNPVPVYSPSGRPLAVKQDNSKVYDRVERVNIPDTTTYPVVIDMKKSNRVAFQLLLSCAGGTLTFTIEGTMNDADDHNDVPAAEWTTTLTNDVFGVASLQAAAGSAVDEWVDNAGKLAPYRWLRLKSVAATGGASGDYTVNHVHWTE